MLYVLLIFMDVLHLQTDANTQFKHPNVPDRRVFFPLGIVWMVLRGLDTGSQELKSLASYCLRIRARKKRARESSDQPGYSETCTEKQSIIHITINTHISV